MKKSIFADVNKAMTEGAFGLQHPVYPNEMLFPPVFAEQETAADFGRVVSIAYNQPDTINFYNENASSAYEFFKLQPFSPYFLSPRMFAVSASVYLIEREWLVVLYSPSSFRLIEADKQILPVKMITFNDYQGNGTIFLQNGQNIPIADTYDVMRLLAVRIVSVEECNRVTREAIAEVKNKHNL